MKHTFDNYCGLKWPYSSLESDMWVNGGCFHYSTLISERDTFLNVIGDLARHSRHITQSTLLLCNWQNDLTRAYLQWNRRKNSCYSRIPWRIDYCIDSEEMNQDKIMSFVHSPHQVVNDLSLICRVFLPIRGATPLEQTEGILMSVQ